MKKTIPFKHSIPFENKIDEITSISLEHTLHKEENAVVGEFVISGTYKLMDNVNHEEEFHNEIPCHIDLDEHYDISNIVVDISDFYYEIMNDTVLVVNIEVIIDKLVEKEIAVTKQVVTIDANNIEGEVDNNLNSNLQAIETEERDLGDVVNTIAHSEENIDAYVTYHIHIVREGDTVNSILEKYNLTNDMLCLYNDISNLQIGDKLIIATNEN